MPSCKIPLFLSDISNTCLFQQFPRNPQIYAFMKILPQSFLMQRVRQAARGTDRHDKSNSRFSQFRENTYKQNAQYGGQVFLCLTW